MLESTKMAHAAEAALRFLRRHADENVRKAAEAIRENLDMAVEKRSALVVKDRIGKYLKAHRSLLSGLGFEADFGRMAEKAEKDRLTPVRRKGRLKG